MSALYEFKRNERQPRLQNIEDSFQMGMQYTAVPLQEGYSKLLVNFDLQDAGASLTPRPGLRTTSYYVPDDSIESPLTGEEQVLRASERYEDTAPRAQFLVLKELSDDFSGRIRFGELTMLTDEGTSIEDVFPVNTKIYLQETYENAAFIVPNNAEIHGMSLSDATTLARHAGTYAWNGNYYFFDPVSGELVHTEMDEDEECFKFKAHTPKELRANMAVSWGYNMLHEDPYSFVDAFSGVGAIIDFDGILPYNVDGKLNLTPVTNETLNFRLYYSVPTNARYHLVWDWRGMQSDSWTTIRAYDVQFDTLKEQVVAFSPPDNDVILRVTAYGYTQVDGAWVRNSVSDATIAVGFNFDKNSYGSTSNLGETNYSIALASGATYWKNRMIVWGVPEDPTILFASDINDPTYFPYPNSVEAFDEPIKYAAPFLDYLLVFTSSKLHLLRLTEDGMGWTTEVIQNNLSIADWDIHLIQVVKNMVFFRSGNYYYMIVPKASSTTGELTLAAVSRPLYYFFDNFEESVKKVVEDVYWYTGPLTLQHYYNYLDFEDIHNTYVFKTDKEEYLNFCMLYNVVDRSWRIYCYGSQSIRVPYKADATQRGTLCSLGSIASGETTVAAPQLFKFNRTNLKDWYLPKGCTTENYAALLEEIHVFFNWQHLDTGYREHKSNFKKRYREVQFVINNISNLSLNFYTDFYIDGEWRKSRYTYQVVQEKDPASPNYGVITVERVLAEPGVAPATTALGVDEVDYPAWRLDVSMLPDVSFWKVRIPVSGKGYTPRFNFTSPNEEIYELLNVSYVYRDMYSR